MYLCTLQQGICKNLKSLTKVCMYLKLEMCAKLNYFPFKDVDRILGNIDPAPSDPPKYVDSRHLY